MSSVFDKLSAVNVASKTESKQGLTYLSWAHAWAEVCKMYEATTYTIVRDASTGLPYVYDDSTGYMVFTTVTIENITHEMWLPVMDGANKAMKKMSYGYKTKRGEKKVEGASMFDINKTIMRCLVKNLAMFGLGLNIYAGEDLPITITLDELIPSHADWSAGVNAVQNQGWSIEQVRESYNITNENYELLKTEGNNG
jgi:hypothetical protein